MPNRKTETYQRDFNSYTDAFKAYEDGKHRRYGLLFSVNGGAVATAKLYGDPQTARAVSDQSVSYPQALK
jgi:hypothetical protein